MKTSPFARARTVWAILMLGVLPGAAAEFKPESPASSTIPATTNRVYLADAALPDMVDGRIYVLDAALKGMLEAGFARMMLAGSDKHRIYDTARQVGLWHDLAHVLGGTFGVTGANFRAPCLAFRTVRGG
jgi:hypothetical protein